MLQSFPLALSRLQWNEAADSIRPNGDMGWDWLPGAIDIQRIHLALRDFPVHDEYTIKDECVTDDDLHDAEPRPVIDVDRDERRYSPGFLLTLVLAALIDSHLDVTLAHRLCDKGCLALALASLCSHCGSIRQLAVAILGRYLLVLYSPEARNLSTWRDRPQLALLIKSVHQALTVKMVEEEWELGTVRKIPGVAAIFLAKSSLILARPSDKLFPAISRFVLRIEEDQGAFQDLYRLPSFITLFCSSSDEHDLVCAERTWALRLINDGFLDEDCYKPVDSCHALELIMSSIDSFRLYSGNDQEATLALDALSKMIRRGGVRCQQHVFGRLGLLDWIQAMLTHRPLLETLPSTAACRSFLKLTTTALEHAASVMTGDSMAAAAVCLAPHLMELGASLGGSDLAKTDTSSSQELLSECCKALHVVGTAWKRHRHESEEDDTSRLAGICMLSAAVFFQSIRDESNQQLVLYCICTLPMGPLSTADELLVSFCEGALSVLASFEEQGINGDDEMIEEVLNRLSVVVSLSSIDTAQGESLVMKLGGLRKSCSALPSTRASYQELMLTIRARTESPGPLLSLVSQPQ
jgi:hypothetical protein